MLSSRPHEYMPTEPSRCCHATASANSARLGSECLHSEIHVPVGCIVEPSFAGRTTDDQLISTCLEPTNGSLLIFHVLRYLRTMSSAFQQSGQPRIPHGHSKASTKVSKARNQSLLASSSRKSHNLNVFKSRGRSNLRYQSSACRQDWCARFPDSVEDDVYHVTSWRGNQTSAEALIIALQSELLASPTTCCSLL
ncbi:hypothetical protein BKA80DRAFT_23934 [Phyllosticta citrichinensis]